MSTIKGYITPWGYAGWIESMNAYIGFATEQDYREFIREGEDSMNTLSTVATNNTSNTSKEATMNNTIITIAAQELTTKTVKDLRDLAKTVGIKANGMKKADLVEALTPFCKTEISAPVMPASSTTEDPVYVASGGAFENEKDFADLVGANVSNTEKEELSMNNTATIIAEDQKNKVFLALVTAWLYQSSHKVLGDKKGVLFFVPNKRADLKGVKIASRSRLFKVTGDLYKFIYGVELKGEQFTQFVNEAYNLAVEAGLAHKNGKDIHMNVNEWNLGVKFYTKDSMKQNIKNYAEFVNSAVRVRR